MSQYSDHPLRYMIKGNSSFTNDELDEILDVLNENNYLDSEVFEYNSNYVLTWYIETRDNYMENMCCGIVSKDIELSNGKTVYFAFDYGH